MPREGSLDCQHRAGVWRLVGEKSRGQEEQQIRLMGVRKTNGSRAHALTMAIGPGCGRLASLVFLRMVGSRLVTRGLGAKLPL